MYTGTLPETSNDESWSLTFDLVNAETAEAVDLDDYEITVIVTDQRNCEYLRFTTSNGRVTVTDGEASFIATPTEMSQLCAGRYRVYVRVTDESDFTRQLMAADLPVIEGGPT